MFQSHSSAMPSRRTLGWLTSIAGMLTIFFAAVFLALDAAAAVSLAPLFSLLYAMIGVAPALLAGMWTRNRRMLLLAALFIALIAIAPILDLGPRKSFLREAYAITPGMTFAEVDRRMSAFDRVPSTLATLNAERAVVYRHTFGPGDTDAVAVYLDGTTVIRREIIPD